MECERDETAFMLVASVERAALARRIASSAVRSLSMRIRVAPTTCTTLFSTEPSSFVILVRLLRIEERRCDAFTADVDSDCTRELHDTRQRCSYYTPVEILQLHPSQSATGSSARLCWRIAASKESGPVIPTLDQLL